MLHIYFFILSTALLVSWYGPLRRADQLWLRYWIIFVLFCEYGLAEYLKVTHQNNILLFNIYPILTVCFYLMIFLKGLSKPYVLLVWTLFALSTYFQFDIKSITSVLNSKIYLSGLTLTSISICIHLKKMIEIGNNVTIEPMCQPTTVLGIGILLFYVSSFPLLFFAETLITNSIAFKAYYDLLLIGNIFLAVGYLGAALASSPILKHF